ncbi:embryonic polyadenylate-binding protein 2 isoform X1 [Phacochoerus africanus]|uniref:embryonic polyadenylate-binding protein 2 isoform X1 n=1 Tax=Phacochoerus africanus TaxID=41426 RepID=UPI001FDA818D|nr:embryonic polyadenylate-binding protein 2 isoform X1 [Phacochoerus africanus]
MWPFLSRALFPPPTEAWLQRASSDPEAQGWGAWSRAEKTPLGAGGGGREAEETVEPQAEDQGDTGFLPSLLEREGLAEGSVPDQELEAIKLKLWAMEQAQGPEPQAQQQEEEDAGALLAGQLPSPEADTPTEKVEADHRSIYVGNVDYEGTARELEAYFNHCGEIHRVTILCDKFSGHPKGYAYIEFATESSAQAAVELDNSVFRGRVIKVLPKRTNFPGISSTDRGGLRGHPSARGRPFPHSSLERERGPRFRPRGRNRGRGRGSPWYSPY